ncbi:MAG: SIR2 family protein [Gammaproteobacteria bacterium]
MEELCLTVFKGKGDTACGIFLSQLKSFIKRYVGKNRFLFTLNQDLFLERLFYPELAGHGYGIHQPYMENCLHNRNRGFSNPVFESSYKELKQFDGWGNNYMLSEIELIEKEKKENIYEMMKNSRTLLYFKLHGSIGWEYSSQEKNKAPLVMGRNKKEQIEKEPLFKKYFEIFKESLATKKSDILIIGYSFSDKHINELLVNAIGEHGLRIHIINPQPINEFKACLEERVGKTHKIWAQNIYDNIYGYHEVTLKDIFSPDASLKGEKSFFFRQLEKGFFSEAIV